MSTNRKQIWGWAVYDWANSAFATTVMAGFFPIFFKQFWSAGADINLSTARLGFANSIASLVVALLAPVLGAVADRGGVRKRFLIFFAYLGVLMTACLFFLQKGQWAWAVCIYAAGLIGFSGANIFYDSLLPTVAAADEMDYVSSLGYGLGYLGGGLLFLLNVLMTLWPQKFGLADAAVAVRCAFLSVALWWGLFSILTILWLPAEAPAAALSLKRIVPQGLNQIRRTLGEIRRLKNILLFLIAYWFYIDGVDTIIRMAVDYGLSIGFDARQLIVALLAVQFIGFPAALIFGKLGQRWGTRKAIFLAIGIYMAITLGGALMHNLREFYILAAAIGTVQGGIQALSRSFYARLIPVAKSAEFFGFYNMLGKFAAILGPALMGIVGLVAKRLLMPPHASVAQIEQVERLATRWGMASVLILFIAGAVLFYLVDEREGRKEAARL